MPTKDKVIEDLNWLTDRLSTQVRTVALSVLALAWGLLIGDKEADKAIAMQRKWHLLGIGGTAVVVMFLDFLQYVSGYVNTHSLLKEMERTGANTGTYKTNSLSYRLRMFFFYGKQFLLAAAVLWLLYILSRWLWTYR
jgi:hypothetical protein